MRHLKTVRTHLLWLVHHNKITSEENGLDYTQGLTEQVWRNMYHKGQVGYNQAIELFATLLSGLLRICCSCFSTLQCINVSVIISYHNSTHCNLIGFQIKDEVTVKKYVYFGGIEHSIRREVRFISTSASDGLLFIGNVPKKCYLIEFPSCV